MKCHYTYDTKYGKVWIPGCYQGIYGGEFCTCRSYREPSEETKKDRVIKELEKEVYKLNRIIKKLTTR